MGTREDMIAEMEKLLGVHETNGDNTNKVTEWYGLSGEPWCDQTITYAAWHSGNAQTVCGGGKYAYTVAHANWFRYHGAYRVGTAGIQRGDIVFFNWRDGGDSIDHVGICTGTSAGGAVLTIEGNIENECKRKVRYSDVIAGYGRPAYSGAPSPIVPTPSSIRYVPFPGDGWFRIAPHSPVITSMGRRLESLGCGAYSDGPGPQWTDADKASYARWQRRCGFSGPDANGWPGKSTWDKLKVPR